MAETIKGDQTDFSDEDIAHMEQSFQQSGVNVKELGDEQVQQLAKEFVEMVQGEVKKNAADQKGG